MSNTNFFFLEDNIVCPICLEVFTDPVTTACGHNFCMDCLQDYWDHQAVIGECPYCPQCREPFSSRPRLRKNISLGEIAEKFTQEEARATAKLPLAGPNDIPCDLCSPRKHHKLQELYCRTEGGLVCYTCIREEHKNHDAIPLQEERARKAVSMDFLDKEERAALVQLGNSIQQKQGKLADLNRQNLWLTDLLDNASDQQFLQVEFTPPPCDHSKLHPSVWPGRPCIRGLLSRTQFDASLHTPIRSGFTLAISPFVSCETDYCNLNFDPNTASEELLLFKETHSVLNMGILMESFFGSCQGFNHWPQVLCTRSLCEGCHYWEVEVSDSWVCLGATYSYMHKTGKSCIFYLIGRNNTSWCLEWDSLKFSVWHNNIQTVVKGSYYKTIGVFLDYAAGSLTFYGVTNTMNLIYRFLTTFTEPLYPAVMVSSGGSITLKHFAPCSPQGLFVANKIHFYL
uniref:E3 ubiquitin/ISG15 ligase TRIM25-like n=1 Tax=Gopherus evgoodei TaxID=1825980 RepID=A0A8C4YLA1_9SAUR